MGRYRGHGKKHSRRHSRTKRKSFYTVSRGGIRL